MFSDCMYIFNPLSNLRKWVQLVSPFHRGGNKTQRVHVQGYLSEGANSRTYWVLKPQRHLISNRQLLLPRALDSTVEYTRNMRY